MTMISGSSWVHRFICMHTSPIRTTVRLVTFFAKNCRTKATFFSGLPVMISEPTESLRGNDSHQGIRVTGAKSLREEKVRRGEN